MSPLPTTMDATSPEMIDFVIVPIEAIVASNYILWKVAEAIEKFQVKGFAVETETLRDVGCGLINNIVSWPLIVKEHSRCHKSTKEIYGAASRWLWRAPLFEDSRNRLARYLDLPAGFSASGLQMRDDGAILNRGGILLKQSARDYYKVINHQYAFLSNSENNMREYRIFLTQLMWMRDDPLKRMFKTGFKGEFQDHQEVTNNGKLSHQLESLRVAGMCINPPVISQANNSQTARPLSLWIHPQLLALLHQPSPSVRVTSLLTAPPRANPPSRRL